MLGRLLQRRNEDAYRLSFEFAVVDLETTGLFAGGYDRVIEIGIVVCNATGSPLDEYATLVNPGRDLGPTEIHGIRGRDVADAPTFSEIVGDLSALLKGRVLVAHNARFDRGFLASEFRRAGYELPHAPWVCTMELAERAVGIRRLRSCCEELALDGTPSHCARDDALAAALVLGACLSRHGALDAVRRALSRAPSLGAEHWPTIAPCGRVVVRSEGRPPRREIYIATLLDRLPSSAAPRDGANGGYLELLDRVLEDRLLAAAEADALGEVAQSWGIGRADCSILHDEYMRMLVAAARQDGVVTNAERADLEDVAALLAIDGSLLDQMLSAPFVDRPSVEPPDTSDESLRGSSVCFTGQLTCTIDGELMTREVAETLASERGLVVKQGVTKKLDVLVVADPDSLSGKARKARDYGTRIIVERSFWRSIGVPVD